MDSKPIAVFPDTNLFLHYRQINEIDWTGLLQVHQVEIKIAPTVTRELEEQRVVHQSRKIRERATSALRFLHSCLSCSQVRDGVTLQFLVEEPTGEYAAAHKLNLLLADDSLIGSFLIYSEANPDRRCLVVTGDLPLTVKLTHCQIKFLQLDESLRLPSEPDALEKKIKQLEADLLRYKSREPDLAITFENGQQYSRFCLVAPTQPPDAEGQLQAMLVAAKEKCKPVDVATPVKLDANDPLVRVAEQLRQMAEGLGERRLSDEAYNRQVDRYYRDYEQYLRERAEFETLPMRTIKLELILANSGTCPAEDIHVHLHFPDGFLLYDDRQQPKPPQEPAVPSRTVSLFPSSAALLSGFPLMTRTPTLPHASRPKIRKTNSYDVTFEVEKLNHGFIWHIDPFYVAFESWASAASFQIRYAIHAGNIIDAQSGRVDVIVEKN